MADDTQTETQPLHEPSRLAAWAAFRAWRIGDPGEGRLDAALRAFAEAGRGEAEKPHRPGLRRVVSRDLAPADCLSCGQRWPCEASWRGRAEAAEARLAEVRAVLLEGGQGDVTARCRAIAIVGTEDPAPPSGMQRPAPVVRVIAGAEGP